MEYRGPNPESKLPSDYEKANRALCIELSHLYRLKGKKVPGWLRDDTVSIYGSDKSIEKLNSDIKKLSGE